MNRVSRYKRFSLDLFLFIIYFYVFYHFALRCVDVIMYLIKIDKVFFFYIYKDFLTICLPDNLVH